ncbi:hypothetical protein [Alteraurantiacibacter palmitatis]|uniref:Uncharacterized protein n=1 Tax=Alteraurantiacibacter palmitatis TaxID=2054628 RepID=A0ABV7E8M8_9SPHN
MAAAMAANRRSFILVSPNLSEGCLAQRKALRDNYAIATSNPQAEIDRANRRTIFGGQRNVGHVYFHQALDLPTMGSLI